jgi:hypothetical protein
MKRYWVDEFEIYPALNTPMNPDLSGSTEDLDLGLFFANNFANDYSRIARILQQEIWTRQAIAEAMGDAAHWAPEGCLWEHR